MTAAETVSEMPTFYMIAFTMLGPDANCGQGRMAHGYVQNTRAC